MIPIFMSNIIPNMKLSIEKQLSAVYRILLRYRALHKLKNTNNTTDGPANQTSIY